jgi:sulfur carrier protein
VSFQHLICFKCGAYDGVSMTDINLEINGKSRRISPVSNVRELFHLLGIAEARVAVEVNRKIIRRADWKCAAISDLDRVETVQFAGRG